MYFRIETAVPYSVFKDSGFEVHFATENGTAPKCDDRMLYGLSGKLLLSRGNQKEPVQAPVDPLLLPGR